GEIFAIGILTALTAIAALGDLSPARRALAAILVAISYLGASYFAQGAFKETAEALFVLAFAIYLHDLDRRRVVWGVGCRSCWCRWRWPAGSSSPTASPGSPGRWRSSSSGEPRSRRSAGPRGRQRCGRPSCDRSHCLRSRSSAASC